AVASITVRIYGCNLNLTHRHRLKAWQTGATIYEYPWSAYQKAPSVTVTWGWGSCGLMVDLGNNASVMSSHKLD
ncbi:hypothetical protein K8D10_22720, partial [Aeromonas veronii]|uniref:hypothetical protein n=1 Tax=Aeromonas veronii TaxID=654 RepID=UPI00207D4265